MTTTDHSINHIYNVLNKSIDLLFIVEMMDSSVPIINLMAQISTIKKHYWSDCDYLNLKYKKPLKIWKRNFWIWFNKMITDIYNEMDHIIDNQSLISIDYYINESILLKELIDDKIKQMK